MLYYCYGKYAIALSMKKCLEEEKYEFCNLLNKLIIKYEIDINMDDGYHRKSFENRRNMGLRISVDLKVKKVGDMSILNMPYYIDCVMEGLDNILNRKL